MGARGMNNFASLALLFALAVSPLQVSTAHAQGSCDQVLPGCGICYPGGYDINTVGEVQGAIQELQAPAQGPVRFVVAGERERWVVLASPARFWESAGLSLVPGDGVTVRGSKTLGADGTLYLVAREILPSGSASPVLLRDPRGAPLWNGLHRGNPVQGGQSGAGRGQASGRGRNGGGRGRR